jgi:sigma-B regulation protein RsbU (phosphoserine phosphatase)
LTGPLLSLREDVNIISEGNLEHRAAAVTNDEIGDLAGAFNDMAVSLQTYIANLTAVTAEKERIGAELDIAAKIQASMLPCIFPAFPDRAEFDIYASMLPAKEVGGDFYDFFLIDENTLAVVMADVSGKGVPAALFMVIAKTLIKNSAQSGKSPREVFETVNNTLCENNETNMFVTVFMGYFDIPTGKFTFVNAGHNPPLLRSHETFDWLKTKPGFVIAGMEDMCYKQHEIILNPGDELLLYTDGLTEAANNENMLFGAPALLEAANSRQGLPLKEFTISIKREIDKFVEGAEQADDITMLALKYKGPAMNELFIEATLENTGTVLDFIHERLGDCPPKIQNQIGIAVDEVFSNIARYAYNPETGGATVRIAVGDDITIEFEDSGVAYNPLEEDDPDISLSAGEREIGGLGIFMVKKIMDSVDYQREGGKNILTIKLQLTK